MTYRAIVVACILAGLLGALASGAPVEAATRVAPAKKPSPAEDFKTCRTDPGSARLAACDRAIASGKLAKKDLSLAYELRGGEWFGADDLTKAASDLEQATRLDPTNQSAFVTKARILLAKKDPSGALAATTAALKLYETSYAQAVRGEALQALGRDEEAAAAYRAALDHNPGMDERRIAETGLAALATDPDADAQQCHDLSGQAAIDACTRAIDSGKLSGRTLASSYFYRAYEYLKLADYDRVIANCSAAISADAGYGPPHSAKALALLGKNDAAGALAEAIEGVRLFPESAYAIAARGEAYRALGRRDEAAADYNNVMTLNPEGPSRQIAQAGLAALQAAGTKPSATPGPVADTNPTTDTNPDQDVAGCANNKSDELRSAACSRAIASGKFTGKQLASLYEARGVIYDLTNDYAHAIADFTEAIRNDPTNFYALSFRGGIYLRDKDYAHAIADLSAAVKLNPKDTGVLSERGEAYYATKNYSGALADFSAVIELDPKAISILVKRGDALDKLGRHAEAMADYNKIISSDPNSAAARSAQAGLQGLADEHAAALGLADGCGRLVGDAAIKACDDAIATGKLNGPDLAGVYYGRGTQYAKKPDPESALRDFSEAIRLDPTVKSYYSARGGLYQQLGRRDEAIADYNKVLSFTSIIADDMQKAAEEGLRALGVDPQAAFNDLQSCRGGSADENLSACNRAIASGRFTGNDLVNLLFSRASDYYQRRDFPHAIADYDASIKTQPTNSMAFGYRCASYYSSQDYERALTDCNEAIRLNATDAYSHWARGAVEAKLGQRDQALADYSASLNLNPSDGIRQAALAGMQALGIDAAAADADNSKCHDLSGDEAIAACDRAIASGKFVGTALAVPYVNRCFQLVNKGNYDPALTDCDQGLKLDPKQSWAHIFKSRALLGKNDPNSAILEVNVGLAEVNGDPYALAVRGEVERALGRFDEARSDYMRVLNRNPTGWALTTAQAGLVALDAGAKSGAANPAVVDKDVDPAGDQMSCKDSILDQAIVAACSRAIASGKFSGRALADLYSQRAKAYDDANQLAAGIGDYSAILAIAPDYPDALSNRGKDYLGAKDYDNAIADFSELIKRSVYDSGARSYRGKAYLAKGQYDLAIADFSTNIERLLQLGDKMLIASLEPDELVDRGTAYARKGNYASAIADFTTAIGFKPEDADKYALRADAYRQAGRGAEAIADFSKVLTLTSTGPLAAQAQAGLGALNGDYQACLTQEKDAAIAACGRAIASAKFNGGALAVLYNRKGGQDYELGQFDQALADLGQAIRIQPNYALAYLNSGFTDLAKNDNQAALADFSKLIDLDTSKYQSYALRADVYAKIGDTNKAILDYGTSIRLNPKEPSSYHGRGLAYAQAKDYQHAVADYNEALKLRPDDAQFLIDRGNALAALGRGDAAAADYNRALGATSDTALRQAAQKGLTALGVAPSSGDLEADAQKCQDVGGDDGIAACSRLIASGRLSGDLLAEAYNLRGGHYYDANQFDKSLSDLNEAIRLDPASAPAYSNRGYARLAKNDTQGAIADFSEVIKLHPGSLAYINRGGIYHDLGDQDHAIADYNEAISLDPKQALAFYARGNAYLAKHDYARAHADYDAAVKLDRKFVVSAATSDINSKKAQGDDLAAIYGARADAYFADRDADHALADYSEQIRLQPSNAQAYVGRGHLYSLTGDTDNAITDLSKAIALDPGNGDALGYRGEAYLYGRHDYDRAIADFTASIRIAPAAMANYADRADAYYAKGDYDNAIKDYDASIARAPKEAELYALKARALLAKHDATNALAAANQAVQLSGNNDEAFAIRGDVYRALGRTAEAKADYDKALSIYKDNKTAAAGLKALSGGK